MKPFNLLVTVGVTAIVVGGRTAEAREEFPGQIATDLGLADPVRDAPPCSLCHLYGKTGGDTLVTPFAWAMRARGLTGSDSLDDALARVGADRVDSDGDGAIDVDEIAAGADPNSAASVPNPTTTMPVPDPQLGCAMAGRGQAEGAGFAVALAAAFAWLRRRPRDAGTRFAD